MRRLLERLGEQLKQVPARSRGLCLTTTAAFARPGTPKAVVRASVP